MNTSLFQRIAAIGLLISLAGIAACGSTPGNEGKGEYVDDSVLTTRVKAAVFKDPNLKSAEINVESFEGRVQLSGFVGSQADIDRAFSLARSVEGVTSVANDMKLK